MPVDAVDVSSLLTAAGVGGLAVSWFSRSGERREARAAVRAALSELEYHRWTADTTAETAVRFGHAVRSFEVAALVSGLPREVTERYSRAARVSAALTKDKVARGEPVGIEIEVAEHLERYAEVVADYLWQPFRARIVYKRRLAALAVEERQLIQTDGPDASWLRWGYAKL